MDFGNFGTVSFTKQAKAAPFVDYLAEGKFMATQCKKCGNKFTGAAYYPKSAEESD